MSGLSENPHEKESLAAKPAPQPTGKALSKRRLLFWSLLALLTLAVILVWGCRYSGLLWGKVCYYWHFLGDEQFKERIQDLLEAAGPLGPLLFIAIQILQVILAPFPGEASGFIGGFLFGVPLGMLYSTIGLTLGSVLAFLLGRWLEAHFVSRIVKPETLAKFDFLMERQGFLVSFFLFLIPGFPKDYLCFILGLSHMSLKLFIVMVTVGRLPGTLMLTLQGAKVYEGDYRFTLILIGVCLIMGLVMYYYREDIYRRLKRWGGHKGREKRSRGKTGKVISGQ